MNIQELVGQTHLDKPAGHSTSPTRSLPHWPNSMRQEPGIARCLWS